MVNDNFEANQYDLLPMSLPNISLDGLKLDNYFNQTSLDNGDFAPSLGESKYEVNKLINTVYAEATYLLTQSLTGNIGVRMDYVDMDINYNIYGGTNGKRGIDKPFILPSLNLKYDAAENTP